MRVLPYILATPPVTACEFSKAPPAGLFTGISGPEPRCRDITPQRSIFEPRIEVQHDPWDQGIPRGADATGEQS